MIHRVLYVLSVILLVGVKLAYSWTESSGYTPIEVSSSIVIVDEKGNLIPNKDPLGLRYVVLKPGNKYFVKVQLINNGEGRKMGYPSDTYKGKIRFELRRSYGPDICDPVVFAVYDDQVFKPMEVKEYVIPITLEMFTTLSNKNYYHIGISYWDYEEEKKERKEGKEQEKYIGWTQTGTYNVYQGSEKREQTVNYGAGNYIIYLSEDMLKERFKYYDKEKKRFIKPKEGTLYRNSNETTLNL